MPFDHWIRVKNQLTMIPSDKKAYPHYALLECIEKALGVVTDKITEAIPNLGE